MEEILKKANELGLMIKGTEIYQRFEELTKKLEIDNEAKGILEEYAKVSEEMSKKEKEGGVIEVEEKQNLQDLVEKVSENQLIKEYIATQSYYLNMIMQIQNAISEPDGDAIQESKIIKPTGSGKIITDI
ncbi:MAG: YlbF family regulator [Spirochaetota bacterium]|nr:YlbF family regulator [Spirochaetota bacterium]